MKKNVFHLIVLLSLLLDGCGGKTGLDLPAILMTVAEQAQKLELGLAGEGEVFLDWGDGSVDSLELHAELRYHSHQYDAANAFRQVKITGHSIGMLVCEQNNLTSLDLGNNTALQILYCGGNLLESLNLSKNTELTFLSCEQNRLTALDLSKNTELEALFCHNNLLTEINLSENDELNYLNCDSNNLTTIDLEENTSLIYLSCEDNRLTSLELDSNTELTHLECDSNQLTTLDLSENVALESLKCADNRLTALDLAENVSLTTLACQDNHLSAEALNKLFQSLHKHSFDEMTKELAIDGNPGEKHCNKTIAIDKGWFFGDDGNIKFYEID